MYDIITKTIIIIQNTKDVQIGTGGCYKYASLIQVGAQNAFICSISIVEYVQGPHSSICGIRIRVVSIRIPIPHSAQFMNRAH